MIDKIRFKAIDDEVKLAVYEAFEFIKNHTLHYTWFLAKGQYKPVGDRPNPHVINYRVRAKDVYIYSREHSQLFILSKISRTT